MNNSILNFKDGIVYLIILVISLIMMNIIVPIARKIAFKIKLVDKPNARKVHTDLIPLVGGISIFVSATLVIIMFAFKIHFTKDIISILSLGAVMFLLGTFDDKYNIKAKYKFFIQFIIAFITALSGLKMTSMFGVFGIYTLPTEIQYFLTIIVIMGVVNAYNLMDGIDGLIGGISLVGFSMLFLVSLYYHHSTISIISLIYIGALLGFLKFNFSKKKIFMGDAGSLSLGYILVCLSLIIIEKNIMNLDKTNLDYKFLFMAVFLFFFIPVFDSLRVYRKRIKEGNSPFVADKKHIHHLFLNAGYSHKKSTIAIISFIFILYFLGFGLSTFFSTTLVFIVLFFLFTFILGILWKISEMKEWSNFIKELENKK